MKKRYEKPFVVMVIVPELCQTLESSGVTKPDGPGGAMGKENNSVWEDVDDEDDLLEPVEPKDVWGDNEPSEH